MKVFIRIISLILNIISTAAGVLLAIFGVYDEIMGPAKAEELLEKLHIPLSYDQVLIVDFICIALIFISYILRSKLSKKL